MHRELWMARHSDPDVGHHRMDLVLRGIDCSRLFLSAPCRRALPVLAVAFFVMPLALQGPQINAVGFIFPGSLVAAGGHRFPAGGLDVPVASAAALGSPVPRALFGDRC